jgi:type I restriction enzyme S subunit
LNSLVHVPLGDVAKLNPTFKSKAVASDELVDFLPMSAVNAELTTVCATEQRQFSEVQKGYTNFADGDVLLAKITPCFENGKIAFAKLKTKYGFGSTEFHVIRADRERLDGRYLVHFLRRDEVRVDGARNMTGSAGQRRVPKHYLESLSIPLQTLNEQRRIAAILDQTEALRAKRREALTQLDSLTQSIFIEMFGDPIENPKGFPVRSLGEIIKFEGGSQPPASTFTSEETPETIRLVQIRDFRTDRFKTFIPKNLSRRFFEADDVMIGRYGPPVFQILRGLSGSYNVALMKAVPRDGITKDFVYHLLKEKRLHNFVVANSERTAGQSGVNLELLEKYQAFIPPVEVQREFAKRVSMVDSLKAAMRCSLKEFDILFASLQHRAFAGEL